MQNRNYYYLFILVAFNLVNCTNKQPNEESQSTDSPFTSKINSYMEAHIANGRFNGNLLIAKGDSTIYFNSFGMMDREKGIKNSETTKFLIGSITKPFTAYSILLLEAQGKLSLEDKLSKFFPDFPKADSVSIKQLLTHTSGITNYHAFEDWRIDSKDKNTSPLTTLEKVKTRPYRFSPGERFRYSNTGYILLGLIIEQLSKQSFEDFIQKEILNPLDLKNTGVITNEKEVGNLAKGYSTDPRETVPAEYINYRQPYTSGNMYSTTDDLRKFTQAVMQSTLISKEMTEEIFTVSTMYGYGWGIRNFDSTLAYGHHGGMNGFVGSITYIPSEDIFICLLTNDENTAEYTLSEDLVGMVMGKDVQAPEREKLIGLTHKMKENAIGNYLVKPGDTLKVYELDNNLFLQETGQEKHELFPVEENKYTMQFFEFHVKFTDSKNNKAQKLKFLNKGGLAAERVE